MISTVQRALRPLFVTYFIMGLGSYPTKQPTSRITRLSILYSLITWLAYAYIYYYTMTLFTYKRFYPSPMNWICVPINILTTIVSAIISFYYQKKFNMCMKRLTAVNDTLEQLGNPQAYRRMHMYSKQVLIGWIVYRFFVDFYNALGWVEEKEITWAFCIPYILNYYEHVNEFVDLLFIFFLWYLGTKFDEINEHMRCLFDETYVSKYKWKTSVVAFHRYVVCTKDYKRILWTLMHLHLELCSIARELNLMFGTQITFEMTSYIINITFICFGLNTIVMQFRDSVPLYHWFGISLGTFICVVKIFITNYICEYVKIKAKKIDKMFHQLTNITRYADIWIEIHQFILHAIQHPLNFTGMGFFYFGNDFLRKLCTTVLMYVIIMIQMKIPIF